MIDPFTAYLRERVAAYPGFSGRRLLRELKDRGYAVATLPSRTFSETFVRPQKPALKFGSKQLPGNRPRLISPNSMSSSPMSRQPQDRLAVFYGAGL